MKKLSAQQVNPAAVTRWYPGDHRVVLLIHGFTGTPYDMEYLGKQLHSQGFSVSIPRLPGHGTSYVDFRESGWKQWLRRVIDEYIDLQQQYSEVYIVGLSMGGLLAILLASLFSPARIALAAPAIAVHNPLLRATPLLARFISRYRIPYESNNSDPDIRLLEPEYWSWQQVWGASHLYKLQRLAKRRLHQVTTDTLTIVSHKDETVPVRAAAIIEAGIGSTRHKRVELDESAHVVVNESQRELVAKEICDWFLVVRD